MKMMLEGAAGVHQEFRLQVEPVGVDPAVVADVKTGHDLPRGNPGVFRPYRGCVSLAAETAGDEQDAGGAKGVAGEGSDKQGNTHVTTAFSRGLSRTRPKASKSKLTYYRAVISGIGPGITPEDCFFPCVFGSGSIKAVEIRAADPLESRYIGTEGICE